MPVKQQKFQEITTTEAKTLQKIIGSISPATQVLFFAARGCFHSLPRLHQGHLDEDETPRSNKAVLFITSGAGVLIFLQFIFLLHLPRARNATFSPASCLIYKEVVALEWVHRSSDYFSASRFQDFLLLLLQVGVIKLFNLLQVLLES